MNRLNPLSPREKLPLRLAVKALGLLLLALFLNIPINADHRPALNFRHLLQAPSEANEIAKIRAIAQDSEGNLWFGGHSGLARFDGLEFSFFKHQAQDDSSLGSNYIRSIVCDRDGALWVASDAGLQLFRPEQQNFLMVLPATPAGERATYISMAASASENLWLLAADGVFLFNIYSRQILPKWNTNEINTPLYQRRLSIIFEDRQSRVWLGAQDGEIFVFDQAGALLRQWQINPNKLPNIMDMQFMQDAEGNVWFSGRGVGAAKVNAALDELKTFWAGDDSGLLGNDIAGIGQDHEGVLWLAVDHVGLTRMDKLSQRFHVVNHSLYDPMGPTSNQPQKLFVDRSGDLWIEQFPHGIDYLGSTKLSISRYRRDPTLSSSISHNSVTNIFEDSEKNIWVGTEAGLNQFDFKTHKFNQLLTGEHNAVVTAIAENRQGDLWIGTWADGLYRVSKKGVVLEHLTEKEGLLGAYIWSMLRDYEDQLWIGTETQGLAHYNPKKNTFEHYAKDLSDPKSISNNIVWSLMELDDDHLLVGTDVGLNLFDKKNKSFTRIGADSPFFKSHDIRSLIRLRNGHVWAGTTWGGIIILDEHLRPVGHMGIESGLPSNTVTGMALDHNGLVWAITFAGAAYIDPVTHKVVTITRKQGLAGNYFNRNAIAINQEGSVYLGSADGLSIVAPQSLEPSLPQSVAKINKLSILNREVGPNTPNSTIKKSILFTDELTLDYRDSLIGIGFSTTNLRGGEDVRFRYQLEGVDPDWVNASSERRATYTNLGAGEYRFIVQAGDQKGFWSNSEDALRIIVSPPPWWSGSAKLIYGMAAVMIILMIYLFLSLQQKRRHAELILKTKNDFLSVMSHEIRTPLTGVIGMLQIVLKDRKLNPRTHEQVKMGHLNAQALLNITNDILNINKIEHEGITIENANFNLQLMLNTAIAAFADIAENKNILLTLNVNSDVPEFIVADSNRIRQVLTNLVGNAIKFTKQGTISIYVRMQPAALDQHLKLEITVADTGIGISPAGLAHLFKRFEQIDASTARIYGGSGLGLSICKNLVSAMGGVIFVDSREGKGSIFSFTIPAEEGAPDSVRKVNEAPSRHAYKLNILCAEDFETNQLIIRQLIEEMGHDVTIVENGLEVLKTIAVHQFDLILMDGRMPKMDGTETCSHIRAGVWGDLQIYQRDIPIIALTANITPTDRDGYIAVGMNAIVGKPIDRAELYKAIEAIIHMLLKEGIPLPPQLRELPAEPEPPKPSEEDLDSLFGIAAIVNPPKT